MHKKIWPALILATLVCLAAIASILAVSEKKEQRTNHWQSLKRQIAESRFDSVKRALAANRLNAELAPQARLLAVLYREDGRSSEAAEIHRQLWLLPQTRELFVDNGLALASIYVDTYAFAHAADVYTTLLIYDTSLHGADSMVVARDYNNLGTCYMAWATASTDDVERQERLDQAASLLDTAREIASLRSDNGKSNLLELISANLQTVLQDGAVTGKIEGKKIPGG
jgi:hypothetical protein